MRKRGDWQIGRGQENGVEARSQPFAKPFGDQPVQTKRQMGAVPFQGAPGHDRNRPLVDAACQCIRGEFSVSQRIDHT